MRAERKINANNMQKLLEKLTPTDIIAAIVVVGGLILVGFRINGLVGTLLTAVVFYYFGKQGNKSTNSNV